MPNNNKYINLISLLVLLLIATDNLFAGQQDITAKKAIQLFDAGNYKAAETAFRKLLNKEPENTMLNYYYGASRTENGYYSESDLDFLLNAGKQVTPHRLNYYIGVQYHARRQWDQALKYYNQFRVSVSEKEQKELNLTKKIQQCFDRVNPFEENTEIGPNASYTPATENLETSNEQESDILDISELPAPPQTGIVLPPRKNLPDLPGVKSTVTMPPGEEIYFQINNDITYLSTAHFKTKKGKEYFLKANSLQDKLEQNLKETDELRKNYNNTQNEADRILTGKKILEHENTSYEIKQEITQHFSESRRIENQYWQNASDIERHNFLVDLNKIEAARQQKMAALSKESTEPNDSLIISSSDYLNFTEFTTGQSQKTETNPLIYKIQIGAYSRGVPAYVERLFNKLSLFRKIENYTDENGVVVYTTGNLTNLEDALKMQNQVRQEGIEDAFVVPYLNGKRITLERAKQIEKRNDIERD